jgi:hypothetical protein
MEGLFKLLPILVFTFVVASIIRSAMKVARKLGESPPAASESLASFDPAEAQRTRQIQEEIRRKIAERRGTVTTAEPVARAETTPWEEPAAAWTAAPAEPPVEPAVLTSTAAVLERQQQLADQMRALELARQMEQRKAAEVVATARDETERAAAVVAMRGALLADLRNAPTARRAILLREVLDRPVALR